MTGRLALPLLIAGRPPGGVRGYGRVVLATRGTYPVKPQLLIDLALPRLNCEWPESDIDDLEALLALALRRELLLPSGCALDLRGEPGSASTGWLKLCGSKLSP